MKLSRKIFLYSGILMVLFIVSWMLYMFIMLPSLHRAQILTHRQDDMRTILRNQKTSENCQAEQSSSIYEGIFIPKTGSTVYVCGTYGKQVITLKSDKLKQAVAKVQSVEQLDDTLSNVLSEIGRDGIFEEIRNQLFLNNQYFDIEMQTGFDTDTFIDNVYERDVRVIDEKAIITAMTVKNKQNDYYTTLFGMSMTEKGLFLAMAPSTISDTVSLIPTIMQSVPMFFIIFVLLLFISTGLFLRQLVRPIEAIAKRANALRKGEDVLPFHYKGNDAIQELSFSVDAMYETIHENYQKVKLKNEALQIERERQRAFLLATSHELKTPLATSHLLVNSMIEKIGKYKDPEQYLPEVRSELNRMQYSVTNMLDAYETVTAVEETIDLQQMVIDIVATYHYLFAEKNLAVQYEVDECNQMVQTSYTLMWTILDNMISNACRYADEKSTILIFFSAQTLTIFNQCEPIAQEMIQLLGSGKVESRSKEGHGLGIYLIYQYCKILGMEVRVNNTNCGVEQILKLK